VSPELFVSPTLLKRTILQLQEKLENVKQVANPPLLMEQVTEMEKKSGMASFWDDRDSAEAVLTKLRELKEDLRVITEMEGALAEVVVGHEMLSETEMKEEELAPFQDEMMETVSNWNRCSTNGICKSSCRGRTTVPALICRFSLELEALRHKIGVEFWNACISDGHRLKATSALCKREYLATKLASNHQTLKSMAGMLMVTCPVRKAHID